MDREDAKEIHILLMNFMGVFHQKFSAKLRKSSNMLPQVTKNQIKAMNLLYQSDSLTATEIGKMLDIEKGSLTTLVDQLEAMGLITRRVDLQDRRRVLLSLSEVGLKHMERAMEVYSSALADMFRNVDPQELATFVNSLRYVVEFTAKL